MKKVLFIGILFLGIHCFGQINDSISVNGVNRTYVYYTPSGWNLNQELPLLIVLHGLTQTGFGIMEITNFNQLAEENNFIVCYPDGMNNSFNANMNVTVSTADDKAMIEGIFQHFEQNFATDTERRYLCGFSTGGFMCHKMACESELCLAGIATVSGNMSDTVYANCIDPNLTSVLHIHGTGDPVVAYNGSPTTGVSVEATIEKWRTYLGCSSSPAISAMPDVNLFDFSYPELHSYSSCGNYELELIKIFGGGHQWPGIPTLVGGLGNINMDFYSPEVIWNFLADKVCQSADLSSNQKQVVVIYPNPSTDWIYIEDPNSQFINIQIFDTQGRLLIDSNNYTIYVGDLKDGIYQLVMRTKEKCIKKTFVKV